MKSQFDHIWQRIEQEKIKIERDKIASQKYIAERKNYDSTINKN